MIRLVPFTPKDFDTLISWLDDEDLLFTIAGKDLTYPLTENQLQTYLNDKDSHSFTILDATASTPIGHAELKSSGDRKYKLDRKYKIDKVLVGDRSQRGKGIGKQIIEELLKFAFTTLKADQVELNVFEQNNAAIRCYESCGFTLTPDRRVIFPYKGEDWVALNMTVQK